jgi:hypothetical protein
VVADDVTSDNVLRHNALRGQEKGEKEKGVGNQILDSSNCASSIKNNAADHLKLHVPTDYVPYGCADGRFQLLSGWFLEK